MLDRGGDLHIEVGVDAAGGPPPVGCWTGTGLFAAGSYKVTSTRR
jgi:hypothetical protein